MAAGLFEVQDVGGSTGGVQPQQAVAPAPSVLSSVVNSSALQGLGTLASGIASGFESGRKEALKTGADKALAGYANYVTNLNAAVEQGTKKQSEAQSLQRARYNEILASRPDLAEQLTAFSKSLSSAEGIGNTLAQGTAVDQQIQADTKSATAAGFISPTMTPAQKEDGLNQYRNQQHQLNQMEFASKQLGIVQQKLAIQSSQESIAASRVSRANAAYDLQLKRQKQNVQTAVAGLATTTFDKTRSQLDTLSQQVASGAISQQQGLAELERLKAELNANTMPVRGVAGADYVDSMLKPTMDVIDAQKDFLSGKISKEVYQNQLDVKQIHTNLDIMKDPKMATIVSLNKLMPANFDLTVLAQTGPTVVNYIKNVLNGNPAGNMTHNDPEEQAQTKTYMETVRNATKSLGNNDPRIVDPKETFSEVSAHANQILHGISDFSSAQKQPSQLNNAMDFLASPEFYALQTMGAKFDEEAVQGASNAIQVNYDAKLTPVVRETWQQALTTVGAPQAVRQIGRVEIPVENKKATTDVLRYVWTGNSIQFKPAAGYERNASVLAKAGELQKQLAPLINRSVRVAAHLQGSQDYTKYFKENEEALFGTTSEGAPSGE